MFEAAVDVGRQWNAWGLRSEVQPSVFNLTSWYFSACIVSGDPLDLETHRMPQEMR